MPLYIKSHSQGEFVFDHGWADAFERAGGRYYPKLLAAIPFTPVSGRRRLVAHNAPDGTSDAILNYALAFAQAHGFSSLHLNFLPQNDWAKLESHGMLLRTDQQFHWLNQNYRDFDDFLAALSSRKRKNLRKERAAIQNAVTITWHRGCEITESHWDMFFDFYQDTGARKWGRPYLTRAFFSQLHADLNNDILLIFAQRDGHIIAGTLHLIGGDALYGRYWGALEDHRFLHFELCYYQAIDFAIAHKLARVEAGAQGAHKLARGYVPMTTYSAHHITHDGLRDAVAQYLTHEREHVAQDIEILKAHTPYRFKT